MEGKKIQSVNEIGSDYSLIVLEDGTGLMVKMVAILSSSTMVGLAEAMVNGTIKALDTDKPEKTKVPKEEKVKTPKTKQPEPEEEEEETEEEETETEEEEEGEEMTGEMLSKMTFEELKELIEDNDLDTDPDDFDEEEELQELKEAVAAELGLELPAEEEEESEEEEGIEEEEEEGDDETTWEDLEKLDYDELCSLCDEEKLDTDYDDYDEDDEDKLRRAIAEELGITAPEKVKKPKKIIKK